MRVINKQTKKLEHAFKEANMSVGYLTKSVIYDNVK